MSVNRRSDIGNVPPIDVCAIESFSRLFKSPMSGGRDPVNCVYERSRCCNPVKSTSSGGIVPVSVLPHNLNVVR